MSTTLQPRLHRAAQHGGVAKIKQYVKAGDDINARGTDGSTALFCAVLHDHLNCVNFLLAAGADPSICDNEQYFPLYLAAQHGNIAIAKALLGANADVDAFIDRPHSGTALFMAASRGDRVMVKLLIDAGCDTSKKSADGQHPLTVASQQGHSEVVAMLLDAGADVNAIGFEGVFALIVATQEGSGDIVKILIDKGLMSNNPIHLA